MDIAVDLTPIYSFLQLPPYEMFIQMFLLFGWIPILLVFLFGFKEIWMNYIQEKYYMTQKFILLAIDIPKGNTQSPKAVENIFTYLTGIHRNPNLIETYWSGEFVLSFSLEIVSIGGYTQFLIRTPAQFKNLVESAIYSQYPDAEITEVDDYTRDIPTKYPDNEYDVWGTEFVQSKNSAYPIKTYEEFLHTMGAPEEQFKDPMAVFMDLCSSLRAGEQLWYQILISPLGFDWMKIGDEEVKKILGEKVAPKDNIADKLINVILGGIGAISGLFFGALGGAEVKKEEKDAFKMFNLKPNEKKRMEAIYQKISKPGFAFKSRFVYAAKKDAMNKGKVVNGFVGYIKQFADLDLNNLKPDSKYTQTSAQYFFINQRLNERKGKIVRNYRNRTMDSGMAPGIMNTEELATLWHFPIEAVVRAPLIQKAPGRKGEPPISLPIEEEVVSSDLFNKSIKDSIFDLPEEVENKKEEFIEKQEEENIFSKEALSKTGLLKEPVEKKGTPPSNLPFA